jgi:hypothetical protein
MRNGIVAAAIAAALPAGQAVGAMTAEPVAVLQGLDKIAARVSRIDVPVGQTVRFGTLSVVVRDCEKSAPEDRPENAAFLQIYENRPGEAQKRLFSGWMFSSSPALSALEHAVYDVGLLDCEAATAPVRAAPASPSNGQSGGKSAGKTAR